MCSGVIPPAYPPIPSKTAKNPVSNHFHSFPQKIEKVPCHKAITGKYA
jgi:hypothetical protein